MEIFRVAIETFLLLWRYFVSRWGHSSCDRELDAALKNFDAAIDLLLYAGHSLHCDEDISNCTASAFAHSPQDGELLLLHWISSVLQKNPKLSSSVGPISNFGEDMRDSVILAYLMHSIWPHVCHLDVLSDDSLQHRATTVLAGAEELGISVQVRAEDIVDGDPVCNFWFCTQIFEKFTECCRVDHTYELDEGAYRYIPKGCVMHVYRGRRHCRRLSVQTTATPASVFCPGGGGGA